MKLTLIIDTHATPMSKDKLAHLVRVAATQIEACSAKTWPHETPLGSIQDDMGQQIGFWDVVPEPDESDY